VNLLTRLWDCTRGCGSLSFELAVALGPAPDATLATLWAAELDPVVLVRLAAALDKPRAVAACVACVWAAGIAPTDHATATLWDAIVAYDGTPASHDRLRVVRSDTQRGAWCGRDATTCSALLDLAYVPDDPGAPGCFFESLWGVVKLRHLGMLPEAHNALLQRCVGVVRAHAPAPTWAALVRVHALGPPTGVP